MTELVEYDPSWRAAYDQAASQLHLGGDPDWLIEHIGSTNVPGSSAKPIIDLAVRVRSFDEIDRRRAHLAGVGWLAIRRQPQTHRVLVRDVNGRRTAIAHFFTATQWDTCHQRLFRDWLLNHPDDLARYQSIKKQAAAGLGSDYATVKKPIVLEIVNRARAAGHLPPLADLDSEEVVSSGSVI